MSTGVLSYCGVYPSLLLVEPGSAGYSERAAQLKKTYYRLTRADDARDLYGMRGVFTFSVAVLSDLAGRKALRASAVAVRGEWPRARVLLLGKAPADFEDDLYEECVGHDATEGVLLAVLSRLCEQYWQQRGGTFADWAGSVNRVRRPVLPWPVVAESDPAKTPDSGLSVEAARGWPGSERRFYGGR